MTRIIHFMLHGEEYRAVVQVCKALDRIIGIQIAEILDRHDKVVEETEEMWELVWEKVNK